MLIHIFLHLNETCIFSMSSISTLLCNLDNMHVELSFKNRILFSITMYNESVFFCNNQFYCFFILFNITKRWIKQKFYQLLCFRIAKELLLKEKIIRNKIKKKISVLNFYKICSMEPKKENQCCMTFRITKFLIDWIHWILFSYLATMTLCPQALWTMD